jgi:hypothetical protein
MLSPGCEHRRAAMRPVYVAPAPVVAAPDPCPPGSVTPGFEDVGSGLTAPAPAAPNGTRIVPPASGAEPNLDLPAPGSSPVTAPETVPPNPVPKGARRLDTNSSGRLAMKMRVEPFVNDPNDLFLPPKADRAWRYIVLHHSAHAEGSYAQIDKEHRKNLGTDGCGYHFVIGNGTASPDGQIEVAKRWADQKGGAHCRDAKTSEVNDYGIGICLVGNLDQSAPTQRQTDAARALVDYLRDRYAIPANHVGMHTSLASHPTVCPGKNFPLQAIVGGRSVALR